MSLPDSQEILPNKRLVPLPDRFPIWSDLEVSGLLPAPQGTLPLSPLLDLTESSGDGNLRWPS